MGRARFRRFSRKQYHFLLLQRPAAARRVGQDSNEIYVRFHGVSQWYRYDYSPAELDAWAEKIRETRARRVWAYFNNDHAGYALKNARGLLRRIRVP